jgi:flagellar hook-basal body complex protein FliE
LSISSVGLNFSLPALPISFGQSIAPVAKSAEQSFGAVLTSFAQNTVSALQNGEQVSIDAIQGKASVQSAVMATMEAEQSLQAALAIRDKIVGAFLEISKMQI